LLLKKNKWEKQVRDYEEKYHEARWWAYQGLIGEPSPVSLKKKLDSARENLEKAREKAKDKKDLKKIKKVEDEIQKLEEEKQNYSYNTLTLIIKFTNMSTERSDKEYLDLYNNSKNMSVCIRAMEQASGMPVVSKQKTNFNGIPCWEFISKPDPNPSNLAFRAILFYKNGRGFSIMYADIDSHRQPIEESLKTLKIIK